MSQILRSIVDVRPRVLFNCAHGPFMDLDYPPRVFVQMQEAKMNTHRPVPAGQDAFAGY